MIQKSEETSDHTIDGLLERAKQGGQEAFVELMLPHERIIRGIVRSFLRNLGGYEEDEFMSDILLRAYEILPNFQGNSSQFKSWLRQTTWGVCNNTREKFQKEREATRTDKEQLREYFHSDPLTPDEVYFQKERQECVQKAIQLLPEKFKKAIVAKDIEGLQYDEIAVELSLPKGTVQSRVSRGREHLKKLSEELHCHEMI